MTDEEFGKLNPVIMGLVKQYTPHKEAYLIQGEFFKSHTFIFDTIDERFVQLLKLRCGLYDGRVWTLREIANVMNVSSEDVRQLESRISIKLRHPYRVRLMKEYDDDTFDKSILENFASDFKSLICQDIVSNIYQNSLSFIKDVKVEDLQIREGGHMQYEQTIKNTLINKGIVTCKDLIEYLQSINDIRELGLKIPSFRALIHSICDLVDSGTAQDVSKEIYNELIIHKLLEVNETGSEMLRQEQRRRKEVVKIANKTKAENLKNQIIYSYDDFSIIKLNFNNRVYGALMRSGLDSFHKLINFYFDNNGFTTIPRLGPIGEQDVIEQLIDIGIDCDKESRTIIGLNKVEEFKTN